MRHVFCPCSEDTSGWHSNPFVAKENLFVLCFESCDDSETRQIANRLGCHLWIWSEHAAQFGSGRGKHFNRKIRNGIPSGKAMPCLHGISDSTDGQWFVVWSVAGRIYSGFLGCFRMFSVFFGFTVNSSQKPISCFSVPGSQSSGASTAAKAATVSSWGRPLPPLLSCPRDRVFLAGGAWCWREALWAYYREDCRRGQKECCNCSIASFEHREKRPWLRNLHFHRLCPGTFMVGFNASHVMKMNSNGNFLGPKRPILIAVPPKKPCETEGHPERKPFCGHCRWPGETIHESNVYVARAVGKVPQKRKAKGEPGVGLIGINQRPIIAVDSFHLKKMVACTAQHLTLFFPCKWYQCIYMFTFYVTSTSWIFLTCVLTNPFARMLGACADRGAKRLLRMLQKVLFFFVSLYAFESPSF